jgi:hypothetical protein
MAKIYLHAHVQKGLLERMPEAHSYSHITDHYFLNRRDGKYDTSHYDPAVFKARFLENPDKLYLRCKNHPHLYVDQVLNMEHFKVWGTSLPNWQWMCDNYKGIMRMMKASGHRVSVYGIHFGYAEFQIDWNLGRFRHWVTSMPHKTSYVLQKINEYEKKLIDLEQRASLIKSQFEAEMDTIVLSCYAPYPFTSKDDWQWTAWRNVVDSQVERAKRFFPNKEVSVFIQPHFVGSRGKWQPIGFDVWRDTVIRLNNNPMCDNIYVFTLRNVEFTNGWEKPLFEALGTN